MKLNPQALVLLQLIADHTKPIDMGNGKMGVSFFYPRERNIYSSTLKDYVYVEGAGTVSMFRSMEKKGLIERASKDWKYAYRITAEGRRELEGRKS